MKKPVSLSDIARATGFAISTVSMALRHDVAIPVRTREKICRKAKKLAYFPNPLLAAMGSRRFKSQLSSKAPLAYIRLAERSPEDEMVTSKIIKTQQQHAQSLGYRLDPFRVTDFLDGAQASRILFSRGYLGILLQMHVQLSMLQGMQWDRFSVVGWGEGMVESPSFSQPQISRAIVDHFASVLRLWDEAWKRGYRRIGFVLFDFPQFMGDQVRRGAALTCLQRLPPRLRITPFILRNACIEPIQLAKWIHRHKPDAVLGFNGLISWALQAEGFRIPEDFGFALLHKLVEPEIQLKDEHRTAGMKEMRTEIMLAAVELLDQQIRHHQYGLPREPRTIMINSEWLEGETLPFRHP